MEGFKDILQNYMLISAGSAWIAAQIFKVFTGIFHERKFNIVNLLFGTGGMPSSHSAAVTALMVSAGIQHGLASPEFAISTLLAIVVMRDASGVRREAGKQAKVLNHIIQEIFTSNDNKIIQADLKELLGHTPLQVFVGFLLGVIVAVLLMPLF